LTLKGVAHFLLAAAGLSALAVWLAACEVALPRPTEPPPAPLSNIEFLAKQIEAALINRNRPAGPCEDQD
jgi:hypothetical protein